jgi:hypothetical protein
MTPTRVGRPSGWVLEGSGRAVVIVGIEDTLGHWRVMASNAAVAVEARSARWPARCQASCQASYQCRHPS